MAIAPAAGNPAADGGGWSSRSAFILAAIGAAVGLGNIWRFPTLAGENGGGAFVLFYVACVVLIGLPIVLSEVVIGRHGRLDPSGSSAVLARDSGLSERWRVVGLVEIATAFLIVSFYSVVAGWAIYYVGVLGLDLLANLAGGDPLASALPGEEQAAIVGRMDALFASPGLMIAMHALFMAATMAIVASGVTAGIERAATYLMPAFFVLLIGITVYGAFTGAFAEALAFLFTPDFAKLTPAVMNEALGQALFSLSVGSAALITYGAYASRDTRLAPTSAIIAFADTGVALTAGLMIFPIVFAVGLDAAAGPTLVFQSLPVAFAQMPAGSAIGFLFFVLIFFAALTSSISLLEPGVAWAIDQLGWPRTGATLAVGGAAFAIGVACALGYNLWADARPLGWWSIFADANILDAIDGFTGKVMLPLAALLVSVFVGWRADRRLIAAETGLSAALFPVWRFLIAWLAPVAVAIIAAAGLFPALLAG